MKKNGAPFLAMVASALVGGGLAYLFMGARPKSAGDLLNARSVLAHEGPKSACAYTISRAHGFGRTQPLICSGPVCESERFNGLRTSVGSMIGTQRASGQVTSASVYVHDLQQGEWTCYNGEEMFDPGSLLKIPVLLTYLVLADEIPGMLERRWNCEAIDLAAPQQGIPPTMQAHPTLSYSVAELLELMMVHSDNRATAVLLRHIPSGRFARVFTDLGLEAPVQHGRAYLVNVRDFSTFMKALYNSTLLSPMRSEYALSLMTRSTFMDGLLQGLPRDVEVAHKFGEAVDASGYQLHETALVYAEKGPYLVTVMTKGDRPDALPGVLSLIARLVHDHIERRGA